MLKNNTAFTIFEVAITITVISILVLLLNPNLSIYKDIIEKKAAIEIISEIKYLSDTYEIENKSFPHKGTYYDRATLINNVQENRVFTLNGMFQETDISDSLILKEIDTSILTNNEKILAHTFIRDQYGTYYLILNE